MSFLDKPSTTLAALAFGILVFGAGLTSPIWLIVGGDNPIQAMHPNKAAPTDSTLVDSSRNIQYDKEKYQSWLNQLRAVCTEKGIALILDEVFLGFRLARGGAQAYFNVRADLVTYGKTLGGGLPVGVVCGSAQWMKRFNDQKPADLCFARGTFNAHPYVMATMNAFLKFIRSEDGGKLYKQADRKSTRLNSSHEWISRMPSSA